MAKWRTTGVNFPAYILIAIALMLSACAAPFFGYGTNGLSKEAFTRYVETVFRLQNSMTSELMLLQETGDPRYQDVLLAAEQSMQEACGSLNEYAARDGEGLRIGLLLQRRVEKSAQACEQAALKVKSLLGR
jgi:hypothetical protein